MADIFCKNNAIDLLQGKRVVFFGDSNVRHLYKDLVWLLNYNTLIPPELLRRKGEVTHVGDRLVSPCRLVACRDFRENRKYSLRDFDIEYFFITRCLNEQVQEYLNDVKNKTRPAPDVIIMNSTLWDLTRWGPNGVMQFKENMVSLMKLLNESIPEETMFIWTTAFPPGKNIRKGSLLIKQVEFLAHTVRFDVMEANFYAKSVVVKYGYDVLDLHFHLRMQIHRRCFDGIHYQPLPIRLMTNLLLTHIALSFGHPLPQTVNNSLLKRYKDMVCHTENEIVTSEVTNEHSNTPLNEDPVPNGQDNIQENSQINNPNNCHRQGRSRKQKRKRKKNFRHSPFNNSPNGTRFWPVGRGHSDHQFNQTYTSSRAMTFDAFNTNMASYPRGNYGCEPPPSMYEFDYSRNYDQVPFQDFTSDFYPDDILINRPPGYHNFMNNFDRVHYRM